VSDAGLASARCFAAEHGHLAAASGYVHNGYPWAGGWPHSACRTAGMSG
jgi:hypothetical protein